MQESNENLNDLDLQKAFEVILSKENLNGVTYEIVKLISNQPIDSFVLEGLLRKNEIASISYIKEDVLDLILVYIRLILNDDILSQKELRNVQYLKMLFKIAEGDFYKLRYEEVNEILKEQLIRIYRNDNRIDHEESLHKVGLQELFSLSYDQFLQFANKEDILALEKGADCKDIDSVLLASFFSFNEYDFVHKTISQEVKELVWEKYGGKCVMCTTSENLIYNHIIPIIKGGSNTFRNIELLCDNCYKFRHNID